MTAEGERVRCDFVVAGVGIEPEVPTFAGASVAQSNGVLVDERCRASQPDVYAAGDVANHLHPLFGRVRVEHYNNAEKQGRAAARSMLGATAPVRLRPQLLVRSVRAQARVRRPRRPSWDEFVVRGSLEERQFVGFYLREGQLQAAVGLDRGGDPELDEDSEMAACARLVAQRATPESRPAGRRGRRSLVARRQWSDARRLRTAGCSRRWPATSGLSSSATISSATSSGVEAGAKLGIRLAQHLGVDRARAQADRADAERLALDRDRLGEPDHPVLGDVVRGQPGELLGRVDAGQRGDVDDPSLSRGAHRAERRAAAEKRPGQVDRQRLLPDLRAWSPRTAPTSARRRRRRAPPAGPTRSTAANSASTSSRSADVGGHRARVAACVSNRSGDGLERLASRARPSTTRAPAAASASAVAAPIPRLAPVTSASRPASQCAGSATGSRSRDGRRRLARRAVRGRRGCVRCRDRPRRARGRPRGTALRPGRRPPPQPDDRRAATRNPVVPSTITSGSAPRRNATTGVPHACASAATIPNGSSHFAGQSTTAARAIASHSSVCCDGRVDGDARLGAQRVDLPPRVVGVIAIAEDVDLDAGDPRDRDRVGGSLLRTEPAGEHRARSRAQARSGSARVGMYGGRIASTGTIRRHAFAWLADTHATVGRRSRRTASRMRVGDRRVGRQVEGVHDGRAQA